MNCTFNLLPSWKNYDAKQGSAVCFDFFREGAGGLIPPPPPHPPTCSDGKIHFFFYFGYPDLSLTTQTRFSNLTILNTHKQRTDKLCLVAVANEFVALNDNRKGNFGSFRESNSKMSGWQPLRVLGLALNFGLTWGWVVTCCFKCRCNNSKFILLLAVLDAFTGISEDYASENQP